MTGVVVVTKFCRSKSKAFRKYIDYIDRKEAVRTDHSFEYNLYADYMGNPEKTTALFTSDKNELSATEKTELKNLMKEAQEKDSLMWQTVISFDNRWLAEHGLYDKETGSLDESKLKEVTRSAVGKMLNAEGLDHAVWSAAIHYNTDNIHVHIATVETHPMRKMKEYIQYRTIVKDGQKVREPILDASGNVVKKKEYVGRFQKKSIELCKRSVVNEILEDKDINLKINKIIRESILGQKKKISLAKDAELQKQFLRVYELIPNVNRNLWNYNNNIIKPVRSEIDKLSEIYLKTYHPEEYRRLTHLIEQQDDAYRQAYGNSGRSYKETKEADLYTRLGNQILKEMREYDKEMREQEGADPGYDKIETPGSKVQIKNSRWERRRQIRKQMLINASLASLKRSLKNEVEKRQNEREHAELTTGLEL